MSKPLYERTVADGYVPEKSNGTHRNPPPNFKEFLAKSNKHVATPVKTAKSDKHVATPVKTAKPDEQIISELVKDIAKSVLGRVYTGGPITAQTVSDLDAYMATIAPTISVRYIGVVKAETYKELLLLSLQK